METVKFEERLSSVLFVQLVCLVVVGLSFRSFILAYPSLPHTYPVLITMVGDHVGLVARSWLSVLLLPLAQTVYFLWRAGLVFWVVFSPRALADLAPVEIGPNAGTDPETLIGVVVRMRLRVAFFGSMLSLLTLLCLTYIFYVVLQSEITGAAPSRGPVFIFICLALVVALYASTMWLSFVLRISNRLAKKSV